MSDRSRILFQRGSGLGVGFPPFDRLLVTTLGPFGRAACAVVYIYLLGLIVLLFAPETKGQRLPASS
jgi:hypothetical protein